MLRLQIPRLIKDDDEFSISTKSDDDIQMGMREMIYSKAQLEIAKKYRISANVNWTDYIKSFESTERSLLLEKLKTLLLQTNSTSINNIVIENNISKANREEYIRSATIALMSSPEYQLC
jgi:hypothetical protein